MGHCVGLSADMLYKACSAKSWIFTGVHRSDKSWKDNFIVSFV